MLCPIEPRTLKKGVPLQSTLLPEDQPIVSAAVYACPFCGSRLSHGVVTTTVTCTNPRCSALDQHVHTGWNNG